VNRSGSFRPTAAQNRAAASLCDSWVGAYVRGTDDGALELHTVERGAFRRYFVHRDGGVTLLESRPQSATHVWGYALRIGGGVLAFATVAAMLVDLVDATGFAAAIVGVGLLTCFVGEHLMEETIAPRGRGWKKIGGSDF
jgi:hypothetical protein